MYALRTDHLEDEGDVWKEAVEKRQMLSQKSMSCGSEVLKGFEAANRNDEQVHLRIRRYPTRGPTLITRRRT